MAKRRARNPQGEFLGDSPETKDVNEAWVSVEPQNSQEAEPSIEPTTEVAEETPEQIAEAGRQPAVVELNYGSDMNRTPAPVSKEKIEISVKEKLARKTDAVDSNPFVPNVQLENEVKEIAENKGFPLSRGTEIGARLLARANRLGK